MSGSSKRGPALPSGDTPGKKPSKQNRPTSSRKALFQSTVVERSQPQWSEWTDNEISALIQYIALYHDSENWPTHHNQQFWTACSKAIQVCTGKKERSGSACRLKVLRFLRGKFASISEAEDAYSINYFDGDDITGADNTPDRRPLEKVGKSPMLGFSPLAEDAECKKVPGAILDAVTSGFLHLTKRQREQLIVHLFHKWLNLDISSNLTSTFLPYNFLPLAGNAVKVLRDNNKDNLIYHATRCFGLTCPGTSEPRMPLNKMPFGMIAYNLRFFSADNATKLEIPDDYKSWCQSMYTLFGSKWVCMHNGPMWSYETAKSDEAPSSTVITATTTSSTTSTSFTEPEPVTMSTPESNASASDSGIIFEALRLSLPEEFGNSFLQNENSSLEESLSLPGQDSVAPPTETVVSPVGRRYVSSLWSDLSDAERRENEDSNLSFQDLEDIHGVRPVGRTTFNTERNPLKAKVNIAGPSGRTIRHSVADSEFTKGTEIQVAALQHVHKIRPSARWWVKADGTDMQIGLRESVRNKWSGDVDLGDGAVEILHSEYLSYLKFIRDIGTRQRKTHLSIKQDLQKQKKSLLQEVKFLRHGHEISKDTYEKKRKQLNVSEDSLFALAWDMEGYSKLLEINNSITSTITNLVDSIENKDNTIGNLFSVLSKTRKDLEDYVKGLYMKKRDAASHLLLFMISDEQRNYKPYAIPVRVLKYKTITDAKVRELREELTTAMKSLGMTAVGFVTDGEFNSLRTQGMKRPVSVIQLIMDSKAEARAVTTRQIESFLKPIYGERIRPAQYHPAVPEEDILWLSDFMAHGGELPIPFDSSIHILRRTQYPFFYDPHPWIAGKTETKGECLKSLMTTYIYRHKIRSYGLEGVHFKDHLYVPEVDEDNLEAMHEREDHNHVLKRIATCVRNGTIHGFNVRGLVAAMKDPHTGLTYTALTGKRKQSVSDAEKLLSSTVAKWLCENGYPFEGRFVGVVANWHKASDGRGLSEQTRSEFNSAMLDLILEDWMPWYWYERDYSKIDPNRPIKGIQGLTRELIVAISTNIESQEHRRQYGVQKGLPPEHPRASSTDDVEGIFAFLHELLGSIFDEKAFHDVFPKVIMEYTKRCDPDLPFHHYTGGNQRFNDGLIQSFNIPSVSGVERLDKVQISRRADPGVFVANRAVMPQRGQLTVRSAHFRTAEELPPPPH